MLDCAAAPGGKALHAAERMDNTGRLVALDAHAGKLALVERAARAHGVTIIETAAADLRKAAGRPALARAFDRVLLDAPCSGTGVLGRRADLRWNRSEADISELAAQDRCFKIRFAIERYGLGLWGAGVMSRRLPFKAWRRRVEHRVHDVMRQHVR